MLKTLIKLPIKLALFPLKIALRAAGIMGNDASKRPPSTGHPAPPSREADHAYEPAIPDDIEVQASDVIALVGDGKTIFVDVREARELSASGKINGAVHMPLQDLPRRYEELEKSGSIVLYCARGMRSYNAAMFLRDKGYEGARSLTGGLPGWTSSGGEVVEG